MSWTPSRLGLAAVVIPLGTVTAIPVLFSVWVGYLKLLKLVDPLLKLPGSDVGSPTQVMGLEVEEWARRHANTPKDGTPKSTATPRNLHFPGVWPFDRWSRLITMDCEVIRYVLESPDYRKPRFTLQFLRKLFGNGIFCELGAEHRALRKAYSPVFYNTTLVSLYPSILQKAEQLCHLWTRIGVQNNGTPIVVDVNNWLGRATLDVIAAAGFGHNIDSVENEKDEVFNAFRSVMVQLETDDNPLKLFLSLVFPWIHRIFPDKMSRTFDAAHAVVLRIGRSFLGSVTDDEQQSASGRQPALLKDVLRRITPPNGLAESKLLGHFSTFFFNGSDSTGSSIAWALHYLSLDLDLQQELRNELSVVPNDANRAAALQTVPLLENVVLETLRIMPPLHSTITMATRDDVIRTSEDVVLRDGTITREIHIKKDQMIHIPLLPLNRLTDIWGQDAKEFKPSRWHDVPDAAKTLPGMGALKLMTFLSGPHGCPGHRLALAEMRIFIATIVQHFKIEPEADIGMFNVFVTRPYVRGTWDEHGPRLPLKLTPVHT